MSGAGVPEAGTILPAARAAPSQGDLVRVVARMAGPVFAVVDGGHFDDLPGLLSGAGLAGRSLFLGHGERESERFGPWFVPLSGGAAEGASDRAGDAVRVLGLVGEVPAVVFWSCAAGDVALYGHLRRLNMARLPAWAAAGKEGPEPGVEADLGWEAVLFRHWDPGVLGALLPVLDEGQFSRMLGPAGELAFHAGDYGGTKRVVADPDWPVLPAGMLTIRADQVGALVERRMEASHRRVVAYLREVFPEAAPVYPDKDLMEFVRDADARGRQLGIRTEAGHKRWAYLVMASEGGVTRRPGALHFIQHEGNSPDAQVKRLMEMMIDGLRRSNGTLS